MLVVNMLIILGIPQSTARNHNYVAGFFGKIPMNIARLLFENPYRIILILDVNYSVSLFIEWHFTDLLMYVFS